MEMIEMIEIIDDVGIMDGNFNYVNFATIMGTLSMLTLSVYFLCI